MTEPISPDRLSRLMHDAVRRVTVPPDTLDRIHQGVRRRRAVRQGAAAVLAAAVLAGGSVTGLVVASGGGAGPAPNRREAIKNGKYEQSNRVEERQIKGKKEEKEQEK